jgi:hypothetical protein
MLKNRWFLLPGWALVILSLVFGMLTTVIIQERGDRINSQPIRKLVNCNVDVIWESKKPTLNIICDGKEYKTGAGDLIDQFLRLLSQKKYPVVMDVMLLKNGKVAAIKEKEPRGPVCYPNPCE